jgi:hypothetical protein
MASWGSRLSGKADVTYVLDSDEEMVPCVSTGDREQASTQSPVLSGGSLPCSSHGETPSILFFAALPADDVVADCFQRWKHLALAAIAARRRRLRRIRQIFKCHLKSSVTFDVISSDEEK